jgi:large subunit ribosomal protein L19
MPDLIAEATKSSLRDKPFHFEIGDTVDVHVRIIEGDKERIQVFNGTVIARRGSGVSATFTVRRIVQGEGVERVFPVHSPKVTKVTVKRHSKVRRAKLYYLRTRAGKGVRLVERREGKQEEEK